MPNPQSVSPSNKQQKIASRTPIVSSKSVPRRVGVVATPGADIGSDAGETPSLEDMISDFIEPARELDLLDEEEWDGVDVGYDDPIAMRRTRLWCGFISQATQPATAESPIVPAELDQLPEVTSSNTKYHRSPT